MKILAFDAALGPFAVALDLDGRVTADRSDRNDALEAGLGRISALLASAQIGLDELDLIAVGTGPGSFTGLRIALSFAKALAFGAGRPLCGISSYDILTPPDAGDPILAVVTGRPGIICARLAQAGTTRTACGPTADVAARLLGDWDPQRPLAVAANTEDEFPEIGEACGQVRRLTVPPAWNPAVMLARMARDRAPHPSPHGVAPDYGEMPAVTVPKAGTRIVR